MISLDFDAIVNLRIYDQFIIYNNWFKSEWKPETDQLLTEKVAVCFAKVLCQIDEIAHYSPQKKITKSFQERLFPFHLALKIFLNVKDGLSLDIFTFLQTYFKFVESALNPATVLQELYEARTHPQFLFFWKENENLLFNYFETSFSEAQPHENLDALLFFILATSSSSTICSHGKVFFKKRIAQTRCTAYGAFLAALLNFNRKRYCEINGLLIGVYQSTAPHQTVFRNQCAELFSFLIQSQSTAPLVPAFRSTNNALKEIVKRLWRAGFITPLPACFLWKGINKRLLIDELQNLSGEISPLTYAIPQLLTQSANNVATKQLYAALKTLAEHDLLTLNEEQATTIKESLLVGVNDQQKLKPISEGEVEVVKAAHKALKKKGLPHTVPYQFWILYGGHWSLSSASSSEDAGDTECEVDS